MIEGIHEILESLVSISNEDTSNYATYDTGDLELIPATNLPFIFDHSNCGFGANIIGRHLFIWN